MRIDGPAKIGLAVALVLGLLGGIAVLNPEWHAVGTIMIAFSLLGLVALAVHHWWGRISRPFRRSIANDFVLIEEAAKWVYERGSDSVKEMFRGSVPKLFKTAAEHGAGYVKTGAANGNYELWGRWEDGLPMEKIDPVGADPSAFEAVFGTDRQIAKDLSVKRSDLPLVLTYSESNAKAQKANPPGHLTVARDATLFVGLRFIATGSWGEPSSADGSQLAAISDALLEFRQHAADGAITVWGKAANFAVWEKIDADYWKNHYVDLPDTLNGDDKAKALNYRDPAPIFRELMISRSEFEWEWRR